MFPDNELATTAHISGFLVPVKTLAPSDRFLDWEMGGIALQDPTQGLEVQLWTFSLKITDEVTGASKVA